MSPPLLCLLVIFSADAGKGLGSITGVEAAASDGGAGAAADGGAHGAPAAAGAAAPVPTPPSHSTTRDPLAALAPAAFLARLDALYAQRDDRRILAEQRQLLDERARQAPSDFEILWRAARVYFWMGDDPSLSAEERSKLGKTGWDYAERAVTLAPQRVEGHYWAAVNIGTYALGLGVMRALAAGLEGKFRERLGRAEQIAPGYNHGGVGVAWGRFYEKLPWPKRDRAKAAEHLRKVIGQVFPNNLRARVFLADTLAQEGKPQEAKQLLDQVAAAPIGRYDAPEERRAKALGQGLTSSIAKKLK